MNILFVSHFVPYPPKGGSLQRTFNILKEMAKENSVFLLALNQKALLPDKKSIDESIAGLSKHCKYIKVFDILTDKNKILWYMLLLFNMFSLKPYSVWRLKSKRLEREIRKQLKLTHFDIIYFDTVALAQYAKLATRLPMILNHQNIESQLLYRRSESQKNPLVRFYIYLQAIKLKKCENNVMGKFDLNIVVSVKEGEYYNSNKPFLKIEIIPNGTDIEYFNPQPSPDTRELIFVGGMNWYPNRDAMIFFCNEVFPLVKKAVPDAVINIIGQDPPDKIKKMALKDKSIKVHGFVNDIRGYIAQSAVYVCPIRVGGGTRLKILDAFACGKALVSTTVGCEGIEVTPGEDILISDTPIGFAENVITLLKNKELRKKLEINARKLVVDKYSWGIIGKKIRKILSEAAK